MISLGCDVKIQNSRWMQLWQMQKNAMYKDKTLNRKTINKNIIDTIIDTLHKRNPKEKRHSKDVEDLCVKVGQQAARNRNNKLKELTCMTLVRLSLMKNS